MAKEEKYAIRLSGISKSFGALKVLNSISLEIPRGSFFALLGPSGCGKTTLLRLMGGFEFPDDGLLSIDGKDVTWSPPNKRSVHTVFQSYAVFPHMNVFKNVEYGLRIEPLERKERVERVEEVLELVGLSNLAFKSPDQLSGGQKQRVAIARCLVKRPHVLLLDEPLSALDAKLRERMQLELVRLQKKVGITFVMVTHDQNEALSMASSVAILNEGSLLQVGTPAQVYEYPSCLFVADFIGRANIIKGCISCSQGRLVFHSSLWGNSPVDVTSVNGAREGEVFMIVRPEKIFTQEEEVKTSAPSQTFFCRGRVTQSAYYGSFSHIFIETESGTSLLVNIANVLRDIPYYTFVSGEETWCYWRAQECFFLSR